MYSDKVMDHFQHPRNVGEIENASGVGTVGNAKCGDIMRIYLDIDDEPDHPRCKIQNLRLRRSSCNQQHGNRTGKRQKVSRKQCRLPTKPLWKLWTDFRL